MTSDSSHLPERIAKLFRPRPPLSFIEATDIAPENRKNVEVSGISSLLADLKDYSQNYEYHPVETRKMKEQRERRLKLEKKKQEFEDQLEHWDPEKDPQIRGNPYKTLFVGRLDYRVTELDLQKKFAAYGPIERVRLVRNKEGKPRGYGFVLFEKEQDLASACKDGNGKEINGRRIVVDVERGRTVRSWKPQRLGGGLGGRGSKISREEKNSGRRECEKRGRIGDRGGRRGGRDDYERHDRGYSSGAYGSRERERERIDRDRTRDRYREQRIESNDRRTRPRAY